MSLEVAIALLAAAVPLAALFVKFSGAISFTGAPKATEFVELKTEFHLFRDEVRRGLHDINRKLEK